MNLETGEPLDELDCITKEWCRSIGSSATTVKDVIDGADEAVTKAVQSAIDKVNLNAISNAQKIQKWIIMPKDFAIPTGELGKSPSLE